MPFLATIPSTVKNPTRDPRSQHAAAEIRGQHASDQGDRQGEERERRQAPAREGGLEQEEHADRRGDREDEQALLGGLSLGELPEQLRPELERQLNVPETILELPDGGPEIPPVDVRADVDAPGQRLVMDVVGRRHDPKVGHVGQVDVLARGGVDQQVLDIGEVLPRLRRAPHVDVEGLPVPEEVTHLLPHDQGRR